MSATTPGALAGAPSAAGTPTTAAAGGGGGDTPHGGGFGGGAAARHPSLLHAQPSGSGAPPEGSAPPSAWQGVLAKSGVPQCAVRCLPADPLPATSSRAGTFPEPQGWPGTLDVRMRVDLQYLLGTVWAGAAAHVRAARRVVVSAPADEGRLLEFVRYLADKGRAGVIKLGGAGGGGGAGGRTLYLAPPSPSLAQALGLTWDARREAATLFAVVVPTPQTR